MAEPGISEFLASGVINPDSLELEGESKPQMIKLNEDSNARKSNIIK